MCSFLVTNKVLKNINNVNFFLKKRGPDFTNIISNNKINFVHNLLSLTGEKTIQPLINKNILLLFNGEIYNFDTFDNDTKFLLECYLEFKDNFYKKIDGEFALVLVDFNRKIIIFSGDIFLTKPIYYSLDGDKFGISTYESALKELGFKNIKRPAPNTYYHLSLETNKIINIGKIYNFNLIQKNDSFELWNKSFEESLIKRTKNAKNKILVPMSSGHDSGSIICGLKNINFNNFITYSFLCNEDVEVINQRINILKNINFTSNKITKNEYFSLKNEINKNVEPFYYGYNYETRKKLGLFDDAAIGIYKIIKDCKKYGIKIMLSGQGGDEIYGNNQSYGFDNKFNPLHFTKNLKNNFPWPNFYFGGNYSYLTKEEHIAGSLGVETRYPLLDKNVVQQFLNLTHSLKNKYYKSPIFNYLYTNNFPTHKGKLGFKLDKYSTKYLNNINKCTNIEIF